MERLSRDCRAAESRSLSADWRIRGVGAQARTKPPTRRNDRRVDVMKLPPPVPARIFARQSQHRTALGYAAAIFAVLVTSAYPALTRLSVTTSLTPADLLVFRFGIGALFFAPLLIFRFTRITRAEWQSALPL